MAGLRYYRTRGLNRDSRTTLAPKHMEMVETDLAVQEFIEENVARFQIPCLPSETPWGAYRWSSSYQWLPFEVNFKDSSGAEVQISSYINNLHPNNCTVYSSLEVILARAISMWNDCLVKGIENREAGGSDNGRCANDQRQRGRLPLRIVSYGIRSGPRIPDWAIQFDENKYKTGVKRYLEAKERLDNCPAKPHPKSLAIIARWPTASGSETPPDRIPSPTPELWEKAQQFLESAELGSLPLPANWKVNAFKHFESRVRSVENPDYPEPGDAVSYTDWRTCKDTHRAVVEKGATPRKGDNNNYAPSDALHERYTIRLEDQFRDNGLQIIIKIGGMEWDPQNPTYNRPDGPYDRWQVPGRLNEHIVGTAIYVYDAVNVQDSRIEFRQVQDINFDCYRYSERAPGGLLRETLWPASEHEDLVLSMLGLKHMDVCRMCSMSGTPSYQAVGRLSMPEGRLYTFPSVMEHRFAPLQLIDKSLPGHCRFVTFYLVDPHYRICSTRNVPPQQNEWWRGAASDIFVTKGLPRELADRICSFVHDWPMGEADASLYRHHQMLEREPMDVVRWSHAGLLESQD